MNISGNRVLSNTVFITAVCTVLLCFSVVLSVCIGAVSISPADVVRVLAGGKDLQGGLSGQLSTAAAENIIKYVRLPRTVAAVSAGAALSVSGAIIQTVLANPLASPNIIGVNSGAGFAVALSCAFLPGNVLPVPAAAFAGAFAGVLIVFILGEKTGASRLTIVLAGIAVSQLFTAGIDAVTSFVPEALNGYADFRTGGFSAVTMQRIMPALPVIVIGIAAALMLSGDMDILAYGEDTAKSLGVSVKPLRLALLAVSAALAGAAISFSGIIGFVGLIVPHIVKRICREGTFVTLTLSAIVGAAFVTFCDLAARMLFAPYELPVGIVLAFAGAPFFIWLLIKQRGGRMHA